jgi:hypothetical protein
MRPVERPNIPVAEIVVVAVAVAVADEVAGAELDEETDTRGTKANTAKWTIIPPKHAERESTLKTTQTPVVQTPPGTTNVLATTAVSQDTSSPTASTSNVPGINATKSTRALHH